ncbi:uncharacterized protein K02A2.6-like [Ixodes scapularis]|uniref:uncharacterized protein K02A2.6-like n=1 Tax=Ixodes scapularis TaxID=6945 RepID=UPI001C38829C|nr:uncharacterized protein K02A2.6-like [Ixodes scapularis]
MSRVPEDERRRIIDLCLKEYSQRAIVDLVQRPLKTVNRIIQAYKNEGHIADAPHNRRPRVTTADQDQTIVAAVAVDPFLSARDVRNACNLQLLLSENVQKNWMLFKQKFELYLQATAPDKPRTEATKTATLLTIAGDDALEIFNNFVFAEGESKEDYKTLVAKFEDYCADQQNEVYERYVFRTRTQDEAEPVEQFIRVLRKQARYCNFGQLSDSMIRDQIVFGTNNKKLREKMLRDKDLTLQKAEQTCKAAEASAKQNEAWYAHEEKVDSTTKGYQRRSDASRTEQCFKCNRRHEKRKCPAFGKTCYACQGRKHFAASCNKQVSEVKHDDEGFDILDLGVCGIEKERDWIVKAQLAEQVVSLKVDTGSQANLLPLSVYKRLHPKPFLRPSHAVLRSYSGNIIKHCGVTTQEVTINQHHCRVDFFIVKRSQAILGLQASELLGLVSRTVNSVSTGSAVPVTQEFAHLFQGTGCVKRRYRMVLHDDAVPVVQPARRVPLALREPLREELQRMEKATIIRKVDEPTDWVSPLVIVKKKDGSLRLCMDPRYA